MGDEDRWAKLEGILRKVVREELDARGIKAKTKLGFENGKWLGITEAHLTAWRAAYGSVDIETELNKAAAWAVSNPLKAPKREIARFLNTWFSREQDRSSIRSIPTRSDGSTKPAPSLCAYCLAPSNGSIMGYRHCGTRACMDRAMAGEKPPKMPGIQPKAVAGMD